MITTVTQKLQDFVNIGRRWLGTILSEKLRCRTNHLPVAVRRSHIKEGRQLHCCLRQKAEECFTDSYFGWNPVSSCNNSGFGRVVRPKNAWHRTMEEGWQRLGKSCGELKCISITRQLWRVGFTNMFSIHSTTYEKINMEANSVKHYEI